MGWGRRLIANFSSSPNGWMLADEWKGCRDFSVGAINNFWRAKRINRHEYMYSVSHLITSPGACLINLSEFPPSWPLDWFHLQWYWKLIDIIFHPAVLQLYLYFMLLAIKNFVNLFSYFTLGQTKEKSYHPWMNYSNLIHTKLIICKFINIHDNTRDKESVFCVL